MTSERIARRAVARRIGIVVVFLWFLVGGIAHFVATDVETSIVPPWVPWPRAMVLVSGAFELLGAAGLVFAAHATSRRLGSLRADDRGDAGAPLDAAAARSVPGHPLLGAGAAAAAAGGAAGADPLEHEHGGIAPGGHRLNWSITSRAIRP